ncbi:hypothetical protein AVEN_253791-1 [Araneus ventricosus]|uniref:Integrase p58-like C-terminal domain-containing protein n=1 Tax=Araneus ventricosus TaxID=182803 RepID=A0A4Y2J169_ARAVE|nr:hypothetical protein AVEN_253791-1 [Araneus ventricosus]
MSEVTYEVESMETDKKRRKLKDVVHVLRIKPYYEPKKQLGEEQHVVVSRRPVTRLVGWGLMAQEPFLAKLRQSNGTSDKESNKKAARRCPLREEKCKQEYTNPMA